MISIYSTPINSTANIARHYYLSENGDFENSVEWGPSGVEWRGSIPLTEEQQQRVNEYAQKFGSYNIHSNNCEMFAWYIKTGKRYSAQTQENIATEWGAAFVSLIQPTHTLRSMKYRQIEAEIADSFQRNLDSIRQAKQKQAKAACQEFWKRRDEGRE